jgi:glucose-1-phosphate thymidylyltransferase
VKGLILAGGRGTRLRPITHTRSKQLVPVANKPIVEYAIEHLAEVGITEIGVVIGETGDEIRAVLGDGSRWGVRLTYLDQPQPLGLAHALAVARDYLGDDDVAMYLGDNLLEEGLAGPLAAFRRAQEEAAADPALAPPSALILLAEVPDPTRFGVAEVRDGRVVALVEKPAEPPSDLALAGVYLFTPRIHEAVAAIEPSSRGELEIVDALSWLLAHGDRVLHEPVHGWWLDTGKKDSLLEANRRVLDTVTARVDGEVDAASELQGAVVVEAGARIERSTVVGPVVVGAGSVVVDSRVGPHTSVGPGCRITRSEVTDSVLVGRVTVTDVPCLVDSLIGPDSEVTRTGAAPGATRLLLGDHSTVDLP